MTLPIIAISCLIANPPQAPKIPPQEAISACSGKSEGASCSITTPDGKSLEGSCRNTPDKQYFACVPKNHKPQRRAQ